MGESDPTGDEKFFALSRQLRNELLKAIRTVHAGQHYMPKEVALYLAGSMFGDCPKPAESEVLYEMSKGLSNGAIGRQLHISTETVSPISGRF